MLIEENYQTKLQFTFLMKKKQRQRRSSAEMQATEIIYPTLPVAPSAVRSIISLHAWQWCQLLAHPTYHLQLAVRAPKGTVKIRGMPNLKRFPVEFEWKEQRTWFCRLSFIRFFYFWILLSGKKITFRSICTSLMALRIHKLLNQNLSQDISACIS